MIRVAETVVRPGQTLDLKRSPEISFGKVTIHLGGQIRTADGIFECVKATNGSCQMRFVRIEKQEEQG